MKPRHASLLVLLTLLLSCSERPPTAPGPAMTAAVAAAAIGPSGLVQLSAGEESACGVKVDGTLVCWGNSGFRITPPTGVFTHVAADGPCALTRGGSVVCWGEPAYGRVAAPPGRFTDVNGGLRQACGIRQNGTLACWGRDVEGQSSPPAGTFTQVSSGDMLSCAIAEGGSLQCWGLELYGSPTPTGEFLHVDVGFEHACAVRLDGTLVCWGRNDAGQSSPPAGEFTQVGVGGEHSCGLRTDGEVTCWGRDTWGQATPPTGAFKQISAASNFGCGLRDDGVAVCWGDILTVAAPPAAFPRHWVTGSGEVTDQEGAQIRFSLQMGVRPRHGSAPQGHVTFSFSGKKDEFRSTELHGFTLHVPHGSAYLYGIGWYQGREVTFTLFVLDGESSPAAGAADGFRIELWDEDGLFYDSGGDPPSSVVKPLVKGKIQFQLE